METEQWRPVRGSKPVVWVSSLGRVRTARKGEWSGSPHTEGYRVVGVMIGGKQRTRFVHRLVLEAFVGRCPRGREARHYDGDKSNNRLSNLEWATPQKNIRDKIRHGTFSRGSKRLMPQDVRRIRREHASGRTYQSIASDYGLSKSAVGAIVRRARWSAVK